MKLPIDSIISPDKICNYLLVPKRKNDKSKWLAKAGYFLEHWETLERDLRIQILPLDAILSNDSIYGRMYEIVGELKGPNGIALTVRTIWISENESGLTKFVTLYPQKT